MEKHCFELISYAEEHHEVYKVVWQEGTESKAAFFLNLRGRVKNLLRQHPDIDLIYFNDGLMGLIGQLLAGLTVTPKVITFHGLGLVFPNAAYQWVIRNRLSRYEAAICVSTATGNECLKRGFTPEQVFVVPNGVDHQMAEVSIDRTEVLNQIREQFGVDLSAKKILVTLGRPVKRKGFSWFLREVMPQLKEEIVLLMIGPIKPPGQKSPFLNVLPKVLRDKIQLIAGGVSDEAAVAELVLQPGLQGRVIRTGKVPFPFLQQLLHLADLFIMPNVKMPGDAEGFGLVALEAALSKAVPVAANLEGIPEAIQDGKNGFLLPSADVETWVNKIHDLLADSNQLATYANQFQKFTLEQYGWEQMGKGYLDVFEEIMERT